ncbi:MAG: DUF2065 domain-containing protein [Gammaproteobacteria bacterium]|nr:DUF2065 domain-containing protein [Gammaproteobacteria bacterium]
MWQDILTAIALLLVVEGLLPFLSPAAFKQNLARMLQLADTNLRWFGLASMLAGVLLLYWVK